jgi:serine/threonine-protein phosphatase 6 regulatory ankyrin repeat subunit B
MKMFLEQPNITLNYEVFRSIIRYDVNFDIFKMLFDCPNIGKKMLFTAACNRNKPEYLQFLLMLKIPLDYRVGRVGDTLMHVAAAEKNIEIIKFLVRRGISVNVKNDKGITPIFISVCLFDKKTAKFLIKKGADLSLRDENGGSLMHYASSKIVKFLVNQGLDLDCKANHGETALHNAAMYNNLNCVKVLVESGASVDALTNCGKTPFMVAANIYNLEITIYLAKRGANIHKTDSLGFTVLDYLADDVVNDANKKIMFEFLSKILQVFNRRIV